MRQKHNDERKGRSDQPLFFAFGRFHKFLNAQDALAATPDERIRSVWPFIVSKVRDFAETLSQRELCNFDEEDALLEVWIDIRERDSKWNPEIGEYISFVGPIVHHCLYRLREKSRTVESAKNTSCRIRKYEKEIADGGITDAKLQTMESMLRSIVGPQCIDDPGVNHIHGDGGIEMVDDEDERRNELEKLMDGLVSLSPYEAAVVGASAGLWGHPKKSIGEIARLQGRSRESVRKAKIAAYEKIKTFLESKADGKAHESDTS